MHILFSFLLAVITPAVFAESAIALLLAPQGKRVGHAVCVSPQGHFLTAAELLDGEKAPKLVLAPGGKDEQVLVASIANLQADVGLVLLKVEAGRPLKALPITSPDTLESGSELRSFCASGTGHYNEEKERPPMAAITGQVTTLTKKGDSLGAIQWDAELSMAAAGAPALDADGNVLGIISMRLASLGIQIIIPSSLVAEFAVEPMLSLNVDPIPADELSETRRFQAQVAYPGKTAGDFEVTLALSSPGQAARSTKMTVVDSGHEAKIVPIPNNGPTGPLDLRVLLKDGSVSGTAVDQPLQVRGETLKLSKLAHWTRESGKFTLRGGRELPGTWPSNLTVRVDPLDLQIPANEMQAVFIAMPEVPAALSYTLSAILNGAPLGELTGEIPIAGARVAQVQAQPDASNSPLAPQLDEAGPSLPTDITPTPFLTKEFHKKLPGPIADADMGGGGRFLVLHLDTLRKAAIFDANSAKINYISLRAVGARIQAGRQKLMVYYPGDNLLERWDLATATREVTAPAPTNSARLLIGSHADFGLLPGQENARLDLRTLRTSPLSFESPKHVHDNLGDGLGAASMDGSRYGFWRIGSSSSGVFSVALAGSRLLASYERITTGIILPAGDRLYTSMGVCKATLSDHAKLRYDMAIGVPSYGGDYYLRLSNIARHSSLKEGDVTLDVCLVADDRAIIRAGACDLNIDRNGREKFHYGKRLYLVPQAKILIMIPAGANQIIVRRLDIVAELEKSDIDYLFVDAKAERIASAGKPYNSRVGVRSRAGDVRYSLDSGPNGMKLNNSGVLSWENPEAGEHSIIITIGDKTGQEIFHTFDLKVD